MKDEEPFHHALYVGKRKESGSSSCSWPFLWSKYSPSTNSPPFFSYYYGKCENFFDWVYTKEGWWSLKKIQIKMLTCKLRMNPKKWSITNLSVKICHHNNQGVYGSGIEKYLHTLGTSDFKFSIGTDGSGSQRPRKLDRILDCEILRVDGLWYLLNLHQWQCTPWQQGEQTSKRCVPAAPHKNLSNTIMPNLNPLQESYNTLTLMNMP